MSKWAMSVFLMTGNYCNIDLILMSCFTFCWKCWIDENWRNW